jgi:uncharacterized FlaG/YvyC family protein
MKISKLHIDKFRHLENVEFDFTYPDDFHIKEKRGEPLDKICFIGQSATGKTGLLEILFDCVEYVLESETLNNTHLSLKTNNVNVDVDFELKIGSEYLSKINKIVSYKGKSYEHQKASGAINSLVTYEDRRMLLYCKANLISEKNIDVFTKNPIDLFEKYSESNAINIDNLLRNYNYENINIFNDEVDAKIWLLLLNDILDYRKKFNQKMSELIHKGLLANQNKLSEEFKKWQKDNPNTLEQFAEKFNPILEKLNLEVDTINTEYVIPIKNKRNDEIIPIQNTSTGTKGLLLSFLPLYKLPTKESIILIDEPERSLYPDMQMDLMEYYQNLAPDAQFIVATHSPFIAASFEPEERFILYFGEEGKVAVRRGISPIGDDPNDMLKNDFNLESLMNDKGIEAFERYRKLKKQIALEKNETKKDKLLEEILSLANAYKF